MKRLVEAEVLVVVESSIGLDGEAEVRVLRSDLVERGYLVQDLGIFEIILGVDFNGGVLVGVAERFLNDDGCGRDLRAGNANGGKESQNCGAHVGVGSD